MEEGVAIRIIDVSEIDKVAALFDAYRVFYERDSDLEASRAFIKERLENDEVITFLAEGNEGDSVGFANIYHSFSSFLAEPIWILNDLYVDPEFRRMGITKGLIAAVEKEAAKQNIARLKLETDSNNLTAQSCYVECGWQKSGFIPFVRDIKGGAK